MGLGKKQQAVRLYRGQIPSPGRPTAVWREDRVRFWHAIAQGVSSEDAAVGIGVSPAVGTRWFRQADGVRPCLVPMVSGRYLSFAEREEIALCRARKTGVREIAWRLGRSASTISRELRRNASTRTYDVEYRAMARRAPSPAAKSTKLAVDQRLRAYVQERLAGQVRRLDGTPMAGPQTALGCSTTSGQSGA